ncbi:MAG: hypothetical protein J0H54_04475 [Rhizobiales bacterium]|nr:hypothetical protein [Hyphomicrobiales bacterium]
MTPPARLVSFRLNVLDEPLVRIARPAVDWIVPLLSMTSLEVAAPESFTEGSSVVGMIAPPASTVSVSVPVIDSCVVRVVPFGMTVSAAKAAGAMKRALAARSARRRVRNETIYMEESPDLR